MGVEVGKDILKPVGIFIQCSLLQGNFLFSGNIFDYKEKRRKGDFQEISWKYFKNQATLQEISLCQERLVIGMLGINIIDC